MPVMRRTRRDALLVIGFVFMGSAAAAVLLADTAKGQDDPKHQGKALYQVGCSSCHGPKGQGVTTADGARRGPKIENSGEAAVFYELSTGRMPLASSDDQ